LHEYRYVTTVCFREIDGEKQEEKEDEGNILFSKKLFPNHINHDV